MALESATASAPERDAAARALASAPVLSIIIPCYNEAESVASLHAGLLPVVANLAATRGPVEVIFVDDGSRDGTLEALKSTFDDGESQGVAFRYAQHAANRGLGAALRTGFAAAQGDLVVTTDSDNTYRLEEIPALLDCLTPAVDIVTASPYHPKGGVENVPGYRLVLSQGSSLMYRVLVNRHLHTYTALFRAYRREVVKSVDFEADGFLAGTELLVYAMQRGYVVAEYPTVLHARVAGVSKAKLMRTIRAHLGFQGRVLLHRMGVDMSRSTAQLQGENR
jgi:dolichol-phosphate mannosyltransferase